LRFHLAGINNQNFIMQDEQTGSWWQQITGEAIAGPLKGEHLNLAPHDELSFALWKREHPDGRVLRPDDTTAWKRFSENWEEHTAAFPVDSRLNPDNRLSARTQVLGIKTGSAAKAYPLTEILKHALVIDTVGDVPIAILIAEDKKSLRVFDRTVDGRVLEFFAKPDSRPLRFIDSESGSEWDFAGKAVSGVYDGRQLKKIYSLKDYWFDWKAYNPATMIYEVPSP